MTTKEILAYVKKHPSGRVKVAVADIDGILRGKYISTEKFVSVARKTIGFCDVVFGWDAGDTTYDNVGYTGWHTGYPDTPVRLDLTTFRKIPWEGGVPFFLGDTLDGKGGPAAVCPRQLLKAVVGACKEEGYIPYCSEEFEWFNFAETPQTARDKDYRNLLPLTPGMFGYSVLRSSLKNEYMSDLFNLLCEFDIPVEGLHTETGPGVYEAAIRYTEGVEAGDRAVLFKTAVKEIAYRHGILATFMAKVNEKLPGCSGHIHQSFFDRQRRSNLFHDQKSPDGMSTLMRSYIAGQLHCLPHILPMFAPTVNSYKRLVEGAWAPTTVTWAVDNRTVALRAIPGSAGSCRLETRVGGSDASPYLAMAASLASGLYGIKKKMKLQQAPTHGSGYEDVRHGRLPATLEQATRAMSGSPVAAELFGNGFVDHFVRTREWEWRQHLKSVTDWEMRRYMEII